MSLKFKSSDFSQFQENLVSINDAAEIANKLFDEWLDAQETLYTSYSISMLSQMSQFSVRTFDNVASTKLKLLAIEPIAKCEHPKEQIEACFESATLDERDRFEVFYCRKCRCNLKPVKWEEI